MCIGIGAPDGGQRREHPLDGNQVGDDLDGVGCRLVGVGPAEYGWRKSRQGIV